MMYPKNLLYQGLILWISLTSVCLGSIFNARRGLRHNLPSTISAPKSRASDLMVGLRGGNGKPSAVMSPMLLFVLSVSKHRTSPLNPQKIEVTGPFFQGWLLRTVDHSQNRSFIVICGSFSRAGSPEFTDHYIFGAVQSQAMIAHKELFLSSADVRIEGPNGNDSSVDIMWNAGRHGMFQFTDRSCCGFFQLDEGLRITFNTTSRMPWRSVDKNGNRHRILKASDDEPTQGPEGWLGSRLTSWLLPCHYFVHSVGSQCTYRIEAASEECTVVAKGTNSLVSTLQYPFQWFKKPSKRNVVLEGRAFAHIEGNHGSFFPEGWIWSHSIAPNNDASFSLVLGKFSIAGVAPTNCILYLRRRNGDTIVFRTTDLDTVHHTINGADGQLRLNATSFLKNARVEMIITPQSTVQGIFGITVHVPTAHGFSSNPGCKETYTAVATVRVFEGAWSNKVAAEYTFPLTALEYGGTFTDRLHNM